MVLIKLKKTEKAYTIIELLVSMSIFSMILVIFSQVLFSSLRIANDNLLRANFRESITEVFDLIKRDVRNADNITECTGTSCTFSLVKTYRWAKCDDSICKYEKIYNPNGTLLREDLLKKTDTRFYVKSLDFDILSTASSQANSTYKDTTLIVTIQATALKTEEQRAIARSGGDSSQDVSFDVRQIVISTRNLFSATAESSNNPLPTAPPNCKCTGGTNSTGQTGIEATCGTVNAVCGADYQYYSCLNTGNWQSTGVACGVRPTPTPILTLNGFERTITIAEGTLMRANTQIMVVLNPSNFNYSKTRSDGNDIRFYTTAGVKLSYWVEKWESNGTSIIWVKVPTATASILMKYGKISDTVSESNGNNTFVYFNDFSTAPSFVGNNAVLNTVNHDATQKNIVVNLAGNATNGATTRYFLLGISNIKDQIAFDYEFSVANHRKPGLGEGGTQSVVNMGIAVGTYKAAPPNILGYRFPLAGWVGFFNYYANGQYLYGGSFTGLDTSLKYTLSVGRSVTANTGFTRAYQDGNLVYNQPFNGLNGGTVNDTFDRVVFSTESAVTYLNSQTTQFIFDNMRIRNIVGFKEFNTTVGTEKAL